MPLWPVWKMTGSRGGFDHLVERIGEPIGRDERLERRVELEASGARADEALGLDDGGVAAPGIDAHERDEDVRIRSGGRQHLVVRAPAATPVVRSASTANSTAAIDRSR